MHLIRGIYGGGDVMMCMLCVYIWRGTSEAPPRELVRLSRIINFIGIGFFSVLSETWFIGSQHYAFRNCV